MEISTVVYKHYLESGGVRKVAWFLIRKVLIRLLNDPACSLPIHGRVLRLPLSHPLPGYLKQFQFYDRLPQRISEYIHQSQGHLNCIDVGANIGDTIASFYKEDSDTFLAIEPHPKFGKLLAENWGWNKNVTMVSDFCSSRSKRGKFVIRERAGTASVVESRNGTEMSTRQLDEIVNDNPSAANANVLKIDTDGHDFEVIAGSERLLSRNVPVVLFECEAWQNANYVEDCLRTLKFLNQIGYNHFLLYDNFGNLMGKYALSDLSPFRNLLFYQLTGQFYYFDVLLMKDEDMFQFYRSEVDFFVGKMPTRSLQRTASTAAELEGPR